MKKIKFKQEKTKNGIWTDWINPVMNRYHISCCDCGLVHDFVFWISQGKIYMKANRNRRATSAFRRKRK